MLSFGLHKLQEFIYQHHITVSLCRVEAVDIQMLEYGQKLHIWSSLWNLNSATLTCIKQIFNYTVPLYFLSWTFTTFSTEMGCFSGICSGCTGKFKPGISSLLVHMALQPKYSFHALVWWIQCRFDYKTSGRIGTSWLVLPWPKTSFMRREAVFLTMRMVTVISPFSSCQNFRV